jgi:DNA processing protein
VYAGALESKHPVTVVLGSGLDRVHSRKNRRSVQEILEAGGCVISEHPDGTRPGRRQLIDRERIRTALSAGVLLIQASFSDHAMHTIRFAKSQNLPLAALDPGKHALAGDASGNHFLIKARAAAPIRTEADFQRYLNTINRRLLAEAEPDPNPHEPVPLQLNMWKELSNDQVS